MHKVPSEAGRFVRELAAVLGNDEMPLDVVVAPPFVCLDSAVNAARGTRIQVAAQNIHWEDQGAYTGEISGAMLRDVGCTHVIIGHSERRQYFGETDETVNKKIKAALKHGLIPIFCLGETLGEREQGETFGVVRRQLDIGLEDVVGTDPERFIVAYEPVWAIGTGRTATPDQAQEVHGFLRARLADLWGKGFGQRIRILYGGSVKPDNTHGLMSCEDIDGGLVGGACLKIEDFAGIIKAAW
jgi:triosephosphate isomerase